MKRFTVREFRYPEDSPLARLQELENKLEDGELAEVIPSSDEDLYRKINDLEMALSAERQMAKFYKHKYLEARAGQEKNFGELEEAKRLLEKEYTKAQRMEFVRKPISYALYQTWKKVDQTEKEGTTNDGERADKGDGK